LADAIGTPSGLFTELRGMTATRCDTPCTTSLTKANSLNGSTRNRGPIFLQTWKARSNALNLIVQTSSQRTIARPVLAPATPTVAGNDERERRRRGGIGPRPAGTHHQRLEVVLASKANRDGMVVLAVKSTWRHETGRPAMIRTSAAVASGPGNHLPSPQGWSFSGASIPSPPYDAGPVTGRRELRLPSPQAQRCSSGSSTTLRPRQLGIWGGSAKCRTC
jgi:hypothetical protein